MKNFTRIIMFLSGLAYGCSPYYYAPNKANVPNLREKHDMRIDAGFGGGWVMRGADVQTAYALGSHMGVMVNGVVTNSRGEYSNYTEHEKTTSRYLEVGLGYFEKVKEDQNWVFEVYGGAGKGDYHVRYSENEDARLNVNKYFIQPSVSFTHPRRPIELSIGSRFSGVNYDLNKANLLANYDFHIVNRLVSRSIMAYWEPSFRFSGGSKTIKGFVSVTPAISILDRNIPREIINVNLGVRFTFNTSSKE
jgi:hypothetical protein